MYVRGYLQGSENGRVVTIDVTSQVELTIGKGKKTKKQKQNRNAILKIVVFINVSCALNFITTFLF